MKVLKFFSLASGVFLLSATLAFAQSGWVGLFNGTNLDGWVEHSGQANYTVAEGVLTGESVSGSGNSFLCTTSTFENFELELEFKCDPLLNSGVQIRSEFFPTARTITVGGKEIKVAADRVHGYQVEIDMDVARGRMWTGGIYDEARRGWLFPADGERGKQGLAFSAQGREVSKPGEWNKLRILANVGLLCIDEVGYLSFDDKAADLLFEVVNRRYERKPVILTTNRPFKEWNEVFPNATCIVTLLDRLLHHAEVTVIEGDSYRVRESERETAARRRKK